MLVRANLKGESRARNVIRPNLPNGFEKLICFVLNPHVKCQNCRQHLVWPYAQPRTHTHTRTHTVTSFAMAIVRNQRPMRMRRAIRRRVNECGRPNNNYASGARKKCEKYPARAVCVHPYSRRRTIAVAGGVRMPSPLVHAAIATISSIRYGF